jgi:tetratricopeptide (TPR) repeat protein
MTLNITVATEQRIYQSADYRLTDLVTGQRYDDARNQKIFVVFGRNWLATVCFNGVGRTATLEVSSWLNDVCRATTRDESLGDFLHRLQAADTWLSKSPPKLRRHTFTVAAFVEETPVVSLVSNYERFDEPPASIAAERLTIDKRSLDRPQTFVSGQSREIARAGRRRLARLAASETDPQKVFSALAEANKDVARQNTYVSSSCYTNYLRRTGEGSGRAHGIDIPAEIDRVTPIGGLELISRLQAAGLDLRGRTLKQVAFAQFRADDEYHAIHLRDKPDSAETHSNYGAYLLEKKSDPTGAERAYRKALQLDSKHANALGNLANLLAFTGRTEEAETAYLEALVSAPGQENASYNYAMFLQSRGRGAAEMRPILDKAIQVNPSSGRLHLLRGNAEILCRNPEAALADYRRARELGADQAAVESGYAIALQMSGAPMNDCIGAYRTAIALNPTVGGLKLNMAQVLFAAGLDDQAIPMLMQAKQLELDPPSQLEAHFYSVSHIATGAEREMKAIQRLLDSGARMTWNVEMTVERVRSINPERAARLARLRDILAGISPASALPDLL